MHPLGSILFHLICIHRLRFWVCSLRSFIVSRGRVNFAVGGRGGRVTLTVNETHRCRLAGVYLGRVVLDGEDGRGIVDLWLVERVTITIEEKLD
jgi:hypothetical protein